MITEEDLQTIFSAEFQSDVTPVTYRKYTTDTIPTYTLRLSNLSDKVYIATYALIPEYMTITNPTNNKNITLTQGILLAPLHSTDVIVAFNPAGIDISSESNPEIIFDLQALEEDVPSTTSGGSTSGGASGGGGSGGGGGPISRRITEIPGIPDMEVGKSIGNKTTGFK